jgi:5-methylthioribose kinase
MNYHLDLHHEKALSSYLESKNWKQPSENIQTITIPGAGNMNYVLRVVFENRSIIIKQARNYVEKYPQIAAPKARVSTEAAFYKKINQFAPIQEMMPHLLGLDSENSILILEDLGQGTDYTFLYGLDQNLSLAEIESLTNYLVLLHQVPSDVKSSFTFKNEEMRKLNYEHIFVYPFMQENGFDLDTIQDGLQNLAAAYKKDVVLKSKILDFGTHYLADGSHLLHGDFYPGSWLKTENGLNIIDTEFCFYGNPAFEIGVFLAHLYLTQQPETSIDSVWAIYTHKIAVNKKQVNAFIGIEIMRRLIGLAQLPLSNMTLETKASLLTFAYAKITNP